MGIIQILMDLYAKYDFLRTSSALNEKKKAYLDYIKEDVSDSQLVLQFIDWLYA